MVRTARLVGVCLLLLSYSVLLHAEVIPGRWEKLDSQAPSTGLMVILKSGQRINCFFKESDPASLTVVDPVAGERRIPKLDVDRVETSLAVPDSVINGTFIGFGIGAGGYLAIHAAIVPLLAHDFLPAVAIGGLGALLGFILDTASQRPEVCMLLTDAALPPQIPTTLTTSPESQVSCGFGFSHSH